MRQYSLQRARGFTLMELMVTVTILLILAAIAVPNYRSHVIRANRSDAVAALQRIAAAQEKFYLQNNTYAISFAADELNMDNTSRHYDLSIKEGANQVTFEASARPREGQDQDTDCWVMSIDNQGNMVAENSDGATTTSVCFR